MVDVILASKLVKAVAPGETTGLGARATPLASLRSLASARLGRMSLCGRAGQPSRVAVMPPSTYRVVPWIMRAWSDTRKATALAMSSGPEFGRPGAGHLLVGQRWMSPGT